MFTQTCAVLKVAADLAAAVLVEADLFATTDDILRLLQLRIAAIWTWGHKIAEEKVTPLPVRKRAEILAELRQLVVDNKLDDAAFRQQANALLS